MMRFTGYALLTLLLIMPAAAATLPRVAGPLRIDGDLTDPLWQQALRVDRFYDTRTRENNEPIVKTIAWMGYDSAFLYVAIRCEDPAPQNIRAPLVPRDRVSAEQDFVQFDIDAQNDGKSSSIFRVNARGVQADGTYTESTEVDDFAPDFDFESATKILPDAWQVEMRVPLSSIRYSQRDPQSWRIVFYRVYPRDQRYRFRSEPMEKGQTCWLCKVAPFDGITGLAAAGALVTTPYVTTRAIAPPRAATTRQLDGGLDAKWLAGPSLSIDATLRPDFSQVEADVTELSVNQRFAIFYPEKRPFFMEGADLLSSPIQAIHTRTITSPSWGARITGRPGNHAYTFIAAGDRGGGSIIIPGAAFSSFTPQSRALTILGRYRYSFGASSTGLVLTSRNSSGGYANTVFGPDVLWWPRAGQKLTAQFLVSRTRDSDVARGTGHAAFISWNRTATHLTSTATVQDIDHEFRADSGFLPQTGVRVLQGSVTASAFPKKHVTSLQAGLSVERIAEKENRGLVSQAIYPIFAFEGWRGTVGQLEFHPNEKVRAENGTIRDHDYLALLVRFLPSRRVPFLSLSARTGDEVDLSTARIGTGRRLTAFVRLQPAAPVFAEITASVHRLDIDRALLFAANALNASITWVFTPRQYARIVADGQRIKLGGGARDGFLNGTILYAYRLTWQTSFYAGYGDSRAMDEIGRLGLPRKELFFKASYAIRSVLGGQ